VPASRESIGQEHAVTQGESSNPIELRPVRITAASIPPSARQLAITWVIPAEIGRVEIDWVPTEP
jgi:hypothetical protein